MSWRPEGWDNPHFDVNGYIQFEAGADAMLEALKKQPKALRSGGVTYTGYAQTPELAHAIIERARAEPVGTWIFIPDEEEL